MTTASEVLQAAVNAEGEAQRILFKRAQELDLAERIRACTRCGLRDTATAPVPWEGSSSIAIVGEAPGRDEDREGRPFIGRAGRLLDECLTAAGLGRDQVALINSVSCRPPGNNFDEAVKADAPARCRPWLDEQLDMSGAWLVVAVGNRAFWQFVNTGAGISNNRGHMFWRGKRLVMPTFHPAYALRTPSAKARIVEDLRRVRHVRQGVEAAPVPRAFDPTMLLTELRGRIPVHESESYRIHFKRTGWVRSWSHWLEDNVILVRDDKVDVPAHIEGVKYTVQELAQLATMDRTWGDVHRLHYAKKAFDAQLI